MITKSTITTLLLIGLPAQEPEWQVFFNESATTSLFALAVILLCLMIQLEKK
ncbi:MAG: hypothetical protein OQK12_07805 [Motiliproteus sp.]|nr:hypothetical protein [Motiliproteus sp.]MCW9053821.1 hypothetical protein [Motiliproteus sp.]